MNTIIRQIFISLTVIFYINVYGTDTLTTECDYPSPISNPIGIECYDACFWINNLSSPKIYKLNSDMVLIDSIEIHRSRICGICQKGGNLWVAVDEPVMVDSHDNYLHYRIYRIDLSTKSISDSLCFKTNGTGNDTGLIYGLGIMNDTLFVSTNMGWSSGIYSISPDGFLNLRSYLLLSGLTVIENELWGISRNSYARNGTMITSLTRDDSLEIRIDVNGTDIAYDGNNLFVCNPDQSRIYKLKAPKLSIGNRTKRIVTGKSRSAFRVISFNNEQSVGNTPSLFALNGRIAGFSKLGNPALASQIIIGIDNNRIARK